MKEVKVVKAVKTIKAVETKIAKIQKITNKKAIDLIKTSKGQIFGVAFVKRSDASLRKMAARLGVRQNITGKGMGYDVEEKNLLIVYDMHKHGYRMIPLENILEVAIRNKRYLVEQIAHNN